MSLQRSFATALAPLLALSLAAAAPRPPRATQALPAALAGDDVMRAMAAELSRSAAELQLPGFDRAYFIAYTVKEVQKAGLTGKRGALYAVDPGTRTRRALVDVRVGDYAFDSSDDPELDFVEDGVYEPTSDVPLDGGADALRHALWLQTDLRYKQALASHLKLQGQRVYAAAAEPRRPSFSKAAPAIAADAPAPLTLDRPRWERVVRDVGAILATDPALFDAEVQVDFRVETRWLANTEGARLRTVAPLYAFHATAATRAPDGMLLESSIDLYAPTEAGLPDDATLLERARRLVADLAALRAAPTLDPYTGPALLEPAATGVFFHEVLGHRLEGHRQDADESGQTFGKHLGQAILPPTLSLVDDPTTARLAQTPLNGTYAFDDEGVPAQRVVLIDHGVLRTFLSARRPAEGLTASNGHGRAAGTLRPVARMGNLVVVAHDPVPVATLRDRLLAEVRRQKKPFGLIIRDIAGGSTNTSAYGYQAFKGEARMVYQVDAETGKETLVRGVDVVGTPLVTISKLLAAGDDIGVFNGYCGAESGMIPVSTVAPSTLFSEIELQRSGRARSRAPILAPPPAAAPSGSPPPGGAR
ncbi:MAG: TldD/PmbA family protein [Myxococcales bacterium]|nr:TldD/PmbA family protein [Myxococcales bacterium]MCB9734399.1 TldD/PmbA family protein [Deltaproteobacteria bacterium]